MGKGTLAFGIMLALALATVATAAAVHNQANAFSNAKADFWAVVLGGAPADAGGHAIINYVRGQDRWNVSGEVHNLLPNTTYTVQIGDHGTLANQLQVAVFTTDGDGSGTFSAHADLYARVGGPHYSAVRVMHGGSPHLSANYQDDRDPPQGSITTRGESRR